MNTWNLALTNLAALPPPQQVNKPHHTKRKPHTWVNGIEFKECKDCGKSKQVGFFGRQASTWDRLNHRCRVCDAKYSKAWRQSRA